MYFTGDRNTVNSCCTISILKNPQQFAWCWEIRHQTSKNRRILHESACMLAGGCTPKWAQFRRPSGLAVPTVLLSEKYSCTDHVSTIAKHFPYGTSVCSSLTSENFGQNRYRKSSLAIWSASYSTGRLWHKHLSSRIKVWVLFPCRSVVKKVFLAQK